MREQDTVASNRYRTILLFGPPGSGKGTQGQILGRVPGFFHLSCGEVFRSLNPDSELGKTFLQYSGRGELVPDEYTIQLWREHIVAILKAGRFSGDTDILLLDGIPRNATQAKILDDYIDVRLVIYLACNDEEKMVKRLHRRALHDNRLDDANVEVIRQRFHEYEEKSAPVLQYYPPERIRRVESVGTPLEVLHHVIQEIMQIV